MTTELAERWEGRLRDAFPLDLPPERKLYLLDQFDAGPGFDQFVRYRIGGYTSPKLNLQLEGRLKELGIWDGDGYVIVLDYAIVCRYDTAAIIGVLCHELSHCADMAWCLSGLRDPETLEGLGNSSLPDENFANPPDDAIAPWVTHDLRFLRSIFHYHHRANLAGQPVWLRDLYAAGDRYGLSAVENYADVLREEVHERVGEPITDILETPMPEELRELFVKDAAAFYRVKLETYIRRQIDAGKSIEEVASTLAATSQKWAEVWGSDKVQNSKIIKQSKDQK